MNLQYGIYTQDWKEKRIKAAIEYCVNGLWGEEPDGGNLDIICVRVADFDRLKLNISFSKPTLRKINLPINDRRLLRRGDLVIEKSGGGEKQLVGAVSLFDSDRHATYSNFCARIKVNPDVNSRFLNYLFSALYNGKLNLPSIKQTTGIQNLDADEYFQEKVLFPPHYIQEAIADFLDRETARIDSLIAKEERLLKLLTEKHKAEASRIVTKGLDPDVEFKDSGLEWLGKIPKHWELRKFKHFLNLVTSGSRGWAKFYADSGELFIRIGNLKRGSFELNLENIQFVNLPAKTEGDRTIIKQNDLLFSITAYLGSIALCSKDAVGAYVSQHVALARIRPNAINHRWVAYFYLAEPGQIQLAESAYGGTKVQLALDDIKELLLLVPPRKEQVQLVKFLDAAELRFDSLKSKITRAIELLREKRTALISAAVTGKIEMGG